MTPARMTPEMMEKSRERLGLGAEAFARMLAVSYQTYYSWKSGRTQIPVRIQRLIYLAERADPRLVASWSAK